MGGGAHRSSCAASDRNGIISCSIKQNTNIKTHLEHAGRAPPRTPPTRAFGQLAPDGVTHSSGRADLSRLHRSEQEPGRPPSGGRHPLERPGRPLPLTLSSSRDRVIRRSRTGVASARSWNYRSRVLPLTRNSERRGTTPVLDRRQADTGRGWLSMPGGPSSRHRWSTDYITVGQGKAKSA